MSEYPSCVHCGECCKAAPCGYGEWDQEGCIYLSPFQDGDITLYFCAIHDHIIEQPGADFMPAFGGGCCRTLFNTVRDEVIRRKRDHR